MIAMAEDNNENEITEDEVEQALQTLMLMLAGLEKHGPDFDGYHYLSLMDALDAWERRELYIFNNKLIKVSNGKPVQISMNGMLLNNFPQEYLGEFY
jgi:hypothetical protein